MSWFGMSACQQIRQPAARSVASPATNTIVDLRKLLEERFPQLPRPRNAQFPTGISALDELTDGGLPRGAITEIIAPQCSAGSASVTCALLQMACTDHTFLALVDGRDSFDPQPLGQVRLRHLFWVRCRTAMESLKAADLLLRDGNFPLVILDLVLSRAEELRKIPATSWYRLQRLVEPSPTAFVVLTRRGMISSAQVKIVLENRSTLENLAREWSPAQWKMRAQRGPGSRLQLTEAG